MKTSVVRMLMIFLSLCILLSVAHQLYIQLYSPYKTDVVYEYTFEKQLNAEGYLFKDEVVIENSTPGVVKYLHSNGSRVAVGSDIAQVYQSEEDVAAAEQAQKLDEQISQLSEVQQPGAALESNISVINQQLSHTYMNLITSLDFGRTSQLTELRNELVTLLNKKQIITGKVSDFNDAIASLTQTRDSLNAAISSEPASVATSVSGYFVDAVDGYEGSLSLERADSIAPADLQQMLDGDPPADAEGLGKVITQPKLRYAALVPSDSVADVVDNTSCTVQFDSLPGQIPAVISRVDRSESEGKSLVVLDITQISEGLVLLRQDQAKIVLSKSTGLRVPKAAIRLNDDGEVGVYAIFGANMNFKKVDIIFENEEYALCDYHTGETGYLRLYDTIIVKGKDLYDNKAIQ